MTTPRQPHEFEEIKGEVIAYRPDLARLLESVIAAVFLSQGLYWQGIAGLDEWWYKRRDADMEDGKMVKPNSRRTQSWQWETGLSRSQQEAARKLLKQEGILEEKRMGIPSRLYFRINFLMLEIFILRKSTNCVTATAPKVDELSRGSKGNNAQYCRAEEGYFKEISSKTIDPFVGSILPEVEAETTILKDAGNQHSGSVSPTNTENMQLLSESNNNINLNATPIDSDCIIEVQNKPLDSQNIERSLKRDCHLFLLEIGIDEISSQKMIATDTSKLVNIIESLRKLVEKGKVINSLSGYVITLFNNPNLKLKGNIPQAFQRRSTELFADKVDSPVSELKKLTGDEQRKYLQIYLEIADKSRTMSYDTQSVYLRDTFERVIFKSWLSEYLKKK